MGSARDEPRRVPGGFHAHRLKHNPHLQEDRMFITPGSFSGFGRRLTHDAAERLARNWTTLLLNGIVLAIAGVLIFSIDWTVGSLSTFIGALFIFEGVWAMLTVGIDYRVANLMTGALSA